MTNGNTSPSSLQDRILDIIAKCSDRTIRPARLAAEVGDLSVEDATAELCSVMAAVGPGATFFFERQDSSNQDIVDPLEVTQKLQQKPSPVMVFSFPSDFRIRAQRAKRVQDWKEQLNVILVWIWKVVQILTALGLILSLLILSVAAMLAFVAALIALQRGGNHHQRSGGGGGILSHHHRVLFLRQIQHICFSLQELLWCYAMFGPDIHYSGEDEEDGVPRRDPFLREMAYDLALISSVCCGRAGSIFYWWRVQQLSQRRHRILRGWRRDHDYSSDNDHEVEGVTLIRPRQTQWTDDASSLRQTQQHVSEQPQEHRGVLSVAVEFLFGPPNEKQEQQQERQRKWKLRAAFLVRQSMAEHSKDEKDVTIVGGVSLEKMIPYTDHPPSPLVLFKDSTALVGENQNSRHAMDLATQGLVIVSHFHGVPLLPPSVQQPSNIMQSRFRFPELVSESAIALQHDENSSDTASPMDFASFLCSHPQAIQSPGNRTNELTDDFPAFYYEPERSFTMLTLPQFMSCVTLGVLNFVGVLWFRQATGDGGVMNEVVEFQALTKMLRHSLVPVLWFYARLFWLLALSRLVYLLLCNRRIRQGNRNRQAWALVLQQQMNNTTSNNGKEDTYC